MPLRSALPSRGELVSSLDDLELEAPREEEEEEVQEERVSTMGTGGPPRAHGW